MFFETLTIISGVMLLGILSRRYAMIKNGKTFYPANGVDELIVNTQELAVYLKKVLRYARKIFVQYTFHFFVRVLYYIRRFWDNVYISARDKFMETAVKDKKTVSRFWDYLKDYKTEKEKEQK